MQHDEYRFESTEGIRLKLPPVSNVTMKGLGMPILRYPPSKGEANNAKKRMREYLAQSMTIKNPNLLSEMLKKEYDGYSVAFIDDVPEACNFPIYVINRSNGAFALFKDINKVSIFYPIKNPDLYWTPMSIGD